MHYSFQERPLGQGHHASRRALFDPPLLRYRIDGKLADEQPLTALRRVIHVYAGTALYSNDIEFDVLHRL